MDGGAWWAADHGVARVGHDWATSFHFSVSWIGEGNGNPLQCSCLENPRDGKLGGLPSMGSHRVGHDWSDAAAAAAYNLHHRIKKKNPKRNERTMSICFKSTFMNSAIHSRMIYWKLCVKLFSRCSTLNFKKTTGDSLGSFIILDIKMTF